MNPLKILIIGIGGVYNYGCEAIVRGTEIIVRSKYPDASIVYASYRVADDRKRLEGSQVKVIERGRLHRYSLKNICRKLLALAGVKWDPLADSLGLLEGVDAILSIGGDLYTLAPDGGYSMSFPKFGDACEKQGVPCVLWGASVGPFTANPQAEKKYTKHLRGLSLITARETATVDYLRTLGVSDNVVSCADPAYVVAPEIKVDSVRQNEKFTIGINLSPLSILFTGYSEEEIVQAQVKTIEKLIKELDANIVLIPHVVTDFSENDDDLRYLRKIKKAVATELWESIILLESDPGFVGVKKELIRCDLVIAARMHCAINALAAQIPTLLIAYSQKALGMCQYVYGNDDWVLPLSAFMTEDVTEKKVRTMKNHEIEIRSYLARRIPEIQQEAYRPLARLLNH
jgi:polysaccharide pyruvyl transferase WcaK-like protein